jgi:hypothetical protein
MSDNAMKSRPLMAPKCQALPTGAAHEIEELA